MRNHLLVLGFTASAAVVGCVDRGGFLDVYRPIPCDDGDPCTADDHRMFGGTCRGDRTCVSLADTTGAANLEVVGDSHGHAWADVDGDGWLDLFVGGYQLGADELFINQRDGTFERTLFSPSVATRGGFFADMDNDGDLDLLTVAGSANPIDGLERIWEGDGTGSFTVRTFASSIDGGNIGAASWIDINRDGFQDVLYYGGGDLATDVLINDGNTPTGFSLVQGDTIGLSVPSGNGETGTTADVDNDGDLDVWFNDQVDGVLYMNRGDGTFLATDNGIDYVLPPGEQPFFGTAFGDFDNDGALDLHLPIPNLLESRLYRNDGRGLFAQVTTGAELVGESTRSSAWGDLDHDGDLDLITAPVSGSPPRVFRNNGDSTFDDASEAFGFPAAATGSSAVTTADYDNDGDLDIFISRRGGANTLWQNNLDDDKYLVVFVVGAGAGRAPRDGIGSRVELWDYTGSTFLAVRQIISGQGYACQSPLHAHFGLAARWGGGAGPYQVRVRFADGKEVVVDDVVPHRVSTTRGATVLAQTLEVRQL